MPTAQSNIAFAPSQIIQVHLDQLNPYKNNARTHSKSQLKQICKSIKEFGFTNPILIDQNKNIIAGHARVEAAKLAGLITVPTVCLEHLSEAQKKSYILADNKLAENAGWDMELLKGELEYFTKLEEDFDLTLTGFEIGEIDFLLLGDDKRNEEPPIPPPSANLISQPGDIWHLGAHRIVCGDARDPASYKSLMNDAKAQLIFTDPPYNVPIAGHVCGKGKVKHDEFQMASGEMAKEEFEKFLESVFENLRLNSTDGSIHFICMDWRHMSEILYAGEVYNELKNLCIWNKTNGGMGSLYRSKHELVFVYKNGTAPHINNIELGKNGRYRTNVWDYAGVNTFARTGDLMLHPTVKPVAMVQDAILDCSKPGDIVLDVFGGSGSTLLAAENCNRTAYLMEIDPKYVDVIIRRYKKVTGKEVLHINGSTYEERQRQHGK